MSDRSWMDADTRTEFEENREDLIEGAWNEYQIRLTVNADDNLSVTGDLDKMVEFYMNYRSEIEEML